MPQYLTLANGLPRLVDAPDSVGGGGSTAHPGFRSNRSYYPFGVTAVGTASIAANSATFTLFYIPSATSFNALQISNTGTAGSRVRLALYTVDGGFPSTLLFDSGEIALDATGVKSAAMNQSLQGWVAALSVFSLATPVNSITAGMNQMQQLVGANPNNLWNIMRVSAPFTFGAFPASATNFAWTAENGGTLPLVALRAA